MRCTSELWCVDWQCKRGKEKISSNGLGTSIAHISLRGVRRTTSPRQVSNPPGKYNFSFTPLRLIHVGTLLVQDTKAILPSE